MEEETIQPEKVFITTVIDPKAIKLLSIGQIFNAHVEGFKGLYDLIVIAIEEDKVTFEIQDVKVISILTDQPSFSMEMFSDMKAYDVMKHIVSETNNPWPPGKQRKNDHFKRR